MPRGILSSAQFAALRIEAGTNPQIELCRPEVVTQEVAQCHQPGGFIAMDSRGDVHPWARSAQARQEDQFVAAQRNRVFAEFMALSQ